MQLHHVISAPRKCPGLHAVVTFSAMRQCLQCKTAENHRTHHSALIADDMALIAKRVGTLATDDDASKRAAAATRIQASYRGHVVRQAFKVYQTGGAISEVLYSPAAYGVDLSSKAAPKPRARINASACVVKNTLWLFGGCVEIGDREVRV